LERREVVVFGGKGDRRIQEGVEKKKGETPLYLGMKRRTCKQLLEGRVGAKKEGREGLI